jgi:hypothetical protein
MEAQPEVMTNIHEQKSGTTNKEGCLMARKSDTKQGVDHLAVGV